MSLNQNTKSKKLKHERDLFLPFLGATTLIHGGRKTDGSVGGWARKGFVQEYLAKNEEEQTKGRERRASA